MEDRKPTNDRKAGDCFNDKEVRAVDMKRKQKMRTVGSESKGGGCHFGKARQVCSD